VEDSLVIVDLAIDRMNRIYVDNEAVQGISPELKEKIERERAEFQQQQQRAKSASNLGNLDNELALGGRSLGGFHMLSFLSGIAVALALTGWLRNQHSD
jgi:hypothetical protein